MPLFSLVLTTTSDSFSVLSCSEDDGPMDGDTIVLDGIITIQDTFEIREGKALRIMPGSEITFAPGAIFVAHGNLYIEGTEDKPITLLAEEPIDDHRIITAKSGCKVFNLMHTITPCLLHKTNS